MQVLAGEKLTFVAVAGTGLCFGFVMNTWLIIQRCFCYFLQCLHTAKTFPAFCAATLVRKLEVCGRWVADTAGQVTKGIFCTI